MKEFKSTYQREREKLEEEGLLTVYTEQESVALLSDLTREMHVLARAEQQRERAPEEDLTQITLNA